ncbi:hypothetical protein SUNI508_03775 [Seiridium unicorne]|uniref:Uncharacterized protein n=1 Tax=Seiridium unicorne TaxID=138068 RepID=A0ABR2VA77_9PEZI
MPRWYRQFNLIVTPAILIVIKHGKLLRLGGALKKLRDSLDELPGLHERNSRTARGQQEGQSWSPQLEQTGLCNGTSQTLQDGWQQTQDDGAGRHLCLAELRELFKNAVDYRRHK